MFGLRIGFRCEGFGGEESAEDCGGGGGGDFGRS